VTNGESELHLKSHLMSFSHGNGELNDGIGQTRCGQG